MQSRLIKIISELISINDENQNEDLLNIIDELERVVLDIKNEEEELKKFGTCCTVELINQMVDLTKNYLKYKTINA